MSSTTGSSPAASASACRSCTRSLREAATSTSSSSAAVGLGPMTQKSRLTSSIEKGTYWLTSPSTWSSISSSRSPAGTVIFLVMTAAWGMAIATRRVLVPLRATRRRAASATSSKRSIWPPTTQPGSKGCEASRSNT